METQVNSEQPKKDPLNTLSVMGKVIAVFGVFVGIAFFFSFGIAKITYWGGETDRTIDLVWAAASIAIIIVSIYWWSLTEVIVDAVNRLKSKGTEE